MVENLITYFVTHKKAMIIVGIIIFLIYRHATAPQRRGRQFEEKLSRKINKYLGVTVLRNILFPLNDIETTELDMAFVCRQGIFAIEAKSRLSNVSGSLTSGVWSTDTYQYFKNPFEQNILHIKALLDTIQDKGVKLNAVPVNVVAIDTLVKFQYYAKKEEVMNVYPILDQGKVLIGYADSSSSIKSFKMLVESMPEIYSNEQVAEIQRALASYQATPEQLKAHAKRVKEKMMLGENV